jgi:hypothetical protein
MSIKRGELDDLAGAGASHSNVSLTVEQMNEALFNDEVGVENTFTFDKKAANRVSGFELL